MAVKIEAQSNLFPKVTIYDSNAKPGIIAKAIKLGYTVSVNGTTVYTSPDLPSVDPAIKWATAVGIIAGTTFLIWRIIR